MARIDPGIEPQQVLAEQRYSVEGADSGRTLVIKIAFPLKRGDGDFGCRAEIGDGIQRIVGPMRGCDAFEAMFVALKMIGVELALFTDLASDRFSWRGGQEIGLRFRQCRIIR